MLKREYSTGWQSLMDLLDRRRVSMGLYLSPYLEEIHMHLRSGRRYQFSNLGGDYFVKIWVENAGGSKNGNGDGTITSMGQQVRIRE